MITEFEFQLGRSCPTKILHARAGLPRADDSFAQWMRQEAGKVRALARHLFPTVVEVSGEPHHSIEQRISAGETLADVTLSTVTASCQIDYLVPDGTTLRFYMVVPKAVDLEKHRFGLEFTSQSGWLRREWRERFELIALRMGILQQCFPTHRIIPLIIVPVTNVPCSVEGLHGWFRCQDGEWQTVGPKVAEEAHRLMREICVRTECAPLIAAAMQRVDTLQAFLASPRAPQLGYACKKCEFRVAGEASGYARCWGALADVSPHMFDLGYLWFVQEEKNVPVANRLAREGRVSMADVPRELITGEYADRQLMQIDGTLTGREIIRPELAEELATVSYPLHFLDIETLRSLIPPHRGMCVNGLVLTQLSVHTRVEETAPLTHTEWLNTQPSDPNRRFLAALRAALGDTGTVCIWTRYEEISFRELLMELIASGVEGDDFDWLQRFLVSDRLRDLHDLCFRNYFSPAQTAKGRTSVKIILPAVWSVDSPVKQREPYANFTCDPYSLLKASGAVGDGCAAMEAYLDMQNPERRAEMSAQLLRYCGIDTLAMVFVWDYWRWRLGADQPAASSSGVEVAEP